MARPKPNDLPDLGHLARPGAEIALRVTPGAARDMLKVTPEGLQARVTAPPEKGKANGAVRAMLARAMGVAPSDLTLVRGQAARDKLFRYASCGGRS
ncbi:hypothetical protein CVM52_21155 [Pseudooceanicola lipolyticus]|uniref:UPF0235 protein CVM52_21155 n=1 Tax=Pseudooceanicola lipolyticus TaxID=2029104 RepID=A0A2M8IVU9_9RHOB|nr:DUF167 domain-containing protein [Pseudooceanicola lipolyticus]PJE34654.1 hypothetical protein CVM52_21155 [Pseudooceanicola lipolyticus]